MRGKGLLMHGPIKEVCFLHHGAPHSPRATRGRDDPPLLPSGTTVVTAPGSGGRRLPLGACLSLGSFLITNELCADGAWLISPLISHLSGRVQVGGRWR